VGLILVLGTTVPAFGYQTQERTPAQGGTAPTPSPIGTGDQGINAPSDTPDLSGSTASGTPTATPATHGPPGYALSAPLYHQVLPKDTDPAINDALEPHVAGVAACTQPRGYLLVFLPGTDNKPTAGYVQTMLNYATNNCLHAIGLNYPDDRAVWDDCHRDPDPDCYEKWRLQKLDGIPRSPYLSDGPANSIENRLLKLLQYLAKTYPQEGWDQYLDGSAVRWGDVIASGLSQGGGMAAIMGQVHSVARVAMFASVTDALGGLDGPSPPWVSKATATPPDRYFGLAHMEDQWWPAEQKNWAALNMAQFGDVVNVDTTPAPFNGSHMLTTDIAYNHAIQNGAHPTVTAPSNAQQFDPVWGYMLVPD